MNMEEYLDSIQYAVEGVIKLIHKDKVKRRELIEEIKNTEIASHDKFGEIMADDNTDGDIYEFKAESILLLYKRDRLEEELNEHEAKLKANQDSINVLSGSLLQFAKQAISTIHQNPYDISRNTNRKKSGDVIRSSAKNIVWYNPYTRSSENLRVLDLIIAARNQSEHYETGIDDRINPSTGRIPIAKRHNINVFTGLQTVRPKLYKCILSSQVSVTGSSRVDPVNYAGRVVERLLKWDNIDTFNKHLKSINK
ncbi:hypothetical protein ABE178_15305 [Priestia megaterium]